MAKQLQFESASVAGSFDQAYVGRLEKMMKFKFPCSYLDFMRRNNGGICDHKYLVLGTRGFVVVRFLAFVPDYKTDVKFGIYDIGVIWSQLADRLGDRYVPFAESFGGNYFCFESSPGNEPSVALWDHELSVPGETPTTIHVSNDFPEFVAKLHTH